MSTATDAPERPPILLGTASWTDPSILKSGWYPPEARSAEQRLAHYASQFQLVEVDSTYYALPSERNSELWSERTPSDFTFNVKAYSLLTGHGAPLSRMANELKASLPAELRVGQRQVYMKDLPEAAQRWTWKSFEQALEPLRASGKLGAILFQFPPWFHTSRESRNQIERCRKMLPRDQLAVEFRHASWLEERNVKETLALLKANGLAFVCVDEPQGFRSSVPPVTAVTTPRLAMIRLHGRNEQNWERKDVTVTERFKYLYSDKELVELAPRVQELAGEAERTHVVFNNCYADYGVTNAARMAELLDVPRRAPLPLATPLI